MGNTIIHLLQILLKLLSYERSYRENTNFHLHRKKEKKRKWTAISQFSIAKSILSKMINLKENNNEKKMNLKTKVIQNITEKY